MVGATGIEPVTPTMSTSESPVLYVHIIVFIEFKDLVHLYKMYVQYLYYKCLHIVLYYNPSIRHIPNEDHLSFSVSPDKQKVFHEGTHLFPAPSGDRKHRKNSHKQPQYQYNEPVLLFFGLIFF